MTAIVMRKKPSKMKNKKVEHDGIVFDSGKELSRYKYLLLLEKDGVIANLTMQKPFMLAPSVVLNGRKKPALRYVCDFYYEQDGRKIVEDVKSAYTKTLPVYRIKSHLMKYIHDIDIVEI